MIRHPNQHDDGEAPPIENTEPSPTPTPDPQQQNDNPTPTPDPQQAPDDQPSPEPPDAPDEQDQQPDPDDNQDPPSLWWLLIVLAIIAAAGMRIVLRGPDRIAMKKHTEKEKVFVYGAATVRLLGYANYQPKAGETPLMFAKRVDAVHFYQKQITPLWRILSLSNYSRLIPGPDQTRKAKETYHAIFKETKPLRKLRFLFALMISTRFYTSLDTAMKYEEPEAPYDLPIPGMRKKMKTKGKNTMRGAKSSAPKMKPRKRRRR